MSITTTLLRSRVVEALASPHGVDRYIEIVNPMWAAREVRARIVDIRREVDVPGRLQHLNRQDAQAKRNGESK